MSEKVSTECMQWSMYQKWCLSVLHQAPVLFGSGVMQISDKPDAMRAYREILKTFTPEELERYEVFRRSSLNKPSMKKVARLSWVFLVKSECLFHLIRRTTSTASQLASSPCRFILPANSLRPHSHLGCQRECGDRHDMLLDLF